MDLNLKALIGITYLIPIAITLRKIYTPSFETPEAIAVAVSKIDRRQDAAHDLDGAGVFQARS